LKQPNSRAICVRVWARFDEVRIFPRPRRGPAGG
jgi:hypothetical protein